jgi:hypothetical protein
MRPRGRSPSRCQTWRNLEVKLRDALVPLALAAILGLSRWINLFLGVAESRSQLLTIMKTPGLQRLSDAMLDSGAI